MFMITKFLYEAIYLPRGYLEIADYEPRNHISNYYNYRLGAYEDGNYEVVPTPTDAVVVRKRSMMKIWSREVFRLSDRVLGLLGNRTRTIEQGVDLVYSPSIDPGFEGPLQLFVRNNTDSPVRLDPDAKMGKVIFFDVSDSAVDVEAYLQEEVVRATLLERKRAGDRMLEAFQDVRQPDEDDEPGPDEED